MYLQISLEAWIHKIDPLNIKIVVFEDTVVHV